ncbi:tenascin [Chanos chanos]|uniref:Tenascin n=1 Tax=Chanos chanos TaxID=29144 RepID=A0A6J2W4F0_CHACN|nr:tenascin-like [Chanos chanos]
MTHRINLLPGGACTGGCEAEMAALKGRVEFLEKEMSALKKKCTACTGGQCPNNCSNQGKCEGGKCICHQGFSGPDCSTTPCPSNCNKKGKCVKGKCVCQQGYTGPDCRKGGDKRVKVTVETVTMKVPPEKEGTSSRKKTQLDKTIFLKKTDEKGHKQTVKADVTKPTVKQGDKTNLVKVQSNGTTTGKVVKTVGQVLWEAPQGMFKNFTVMRRELHIGGKEKDEQDVEATEKSHDTVEKLGSKGTLTMNVTESQKQSSNKTVSSAKAQSASGVNTDVKSMKKFSQVLSGTARSFHFRNLRPQTRYSISLFGSSPGSRSKIYRLTVSTGPEPPTDLVFSNITETSLSVSWTKPKSLVTAFKVMYASPAKGENGSMLVDSQLSHVLLSNLSPGSSYEISVSSSQDMTESEPVTATVVTVPDSPANLQAVNITDTKALLVWKPSQAKVDRYILSYGSTKSPNVTVTVMVSGNAVEHQLRGLHRSTLYTVKVMSQINSLQSKVVSTAFRTASAVTAGGVTSNSAVISWKSPRLAFKSYRLTYQQAGQLAKEVILNPTVTQYELTGLHADTNYTVKVDGETEGLYIVVVSTEFSTAKLPYPFPADCSEVQLNGVQKSGEAEVYPEGGDGEPVWVYCDMETEGGGWTVFQRRMDGKTDFYRGWKDYGKGFGHLSAEFWLGNDLLHALTSLKPMSLRIDLRAGNDTAYAHYSNFSVDSEANNYAIEISGYSGTAGDSMRYHNGRPFSTRDRDPSPLSIHCAKAYRGGWWYKNCYKANLNGLYATFSENQGVVWIDWRGKDASIPFTEMKLRPASITHTSQG